MVPHVVVAVLGLCSTLSAIEVSRQVEPRPPEEQGWIKAQDYASLKENRLARAVCTSRGIVGRYSDDNGQTWTGDELILANEELAGGRQKRADFDTFYLDPDNGLFVRFFADYVPVSEAELDKPGAVGPHTRRMYYQISSDAGRSWGPTQQFMQKGDQYNAEHWGEGLYYGQSELVLEGRRITKLPDGTLLLPCYLWPTPDERNRLYRESGPPDWPLDLDAKWYMASVCLQGRWRDDLSGIDWEMGKPLVVPNGFTSAGTCGSDEPTIANLDDGRLFCVVRTSSGMVADFEHRKLPVLRYCATSDDAGRTWKDIRPLTFSDGGALYSPSAYSEFIRSSKNGRWYWIGNILPEPTYGNCDPRHPLQIAELDEKALGIKRDTVTIIQDRPADEPPTVRYSNFRVYEERGSKDFILLVMQDYHEFEKNPRSHPTYRYRITVPSR